jgi:hypothetical protein
MSLGGGTFITQNKVLPGTYINFISMAKASADLSDRGIVAVPMIMGWGVDGDVFTVEAGDVIKNSLSLFGYSYTAPEMKNVREVFRNARKALFYKLNGGTKATATVSPLTATAKWNGVRGNDLRIVITTNIDNGSKKDVTTLLAGQVVDVQTVSTVQELKANAYVVFSGTGTPVNSAGVNLSTGTNSAVNGTSYQNALDKFEAFAFNTLICPTTDGPTIALFDAYTKRMRLEVGSKFQTVVYRTASDFEGVISVENAVTDAGADAHSLVFWVGGAQASAQINRSNTNKVYDGEYAVNVNYKQTELEAGIKSGKFMLHRVGDQIRVLDDINTFVSFTVDKNEDFAINQVVRVMDQLANDIATLFNSRYLGKVQNNASGRVSFWSDVVTYGKQLENIQAIENFDPDEIKVEAGNDKKSVAVTCPITPVSAMTKLYMTVMVR